MNNLYGTEYKLKTSPEIVGPLVSKEWWGSIVSQKKIADSRKSLRELYKRGPYRGLGRTANLLKKYGLDI